MVYAPIFVAALLVIVWPSFSSGNFTGLVTFQGLNTPSGVAVDATSGSVYVVEISFGSIFQSPLVDSTLLLTTSNLLKNPNSHCRLRC